MLLNLTQNAAHLIPVFNVLELEPLKGAICNHREVSNFKCTEILLIVLYGPTNVLHLLKGLLDHLILNKPTFHFVSI
jgi:hypothetical protein